MSISSLATRGVLFALTLLVLASCQSPDTPKDDGFGELRLEFVHKGRAVPGSLIVSDGTFRQEWKNQKRIKAKVPATATYTIDIKLPGDRTSQPITFRDIIPVFEVEAGAVRDVIVNVPGQRQPRSFEPFVLLEDRGANASLVTKREDIKILPPRIRLTSTTTLAPGTQALIDGIYSTDAPTSSEVRDFICGDNCPHLYAGIDCSVYCYGCSTTAYYEGYWRENGNLCEGFAAPAPRGSDFDEIPEGLGGIHLAAATRNDGIVFPLRTMRRGLGSSDMLRPPFKTRSFPDFVAKTGVHLYTLTLPNAGLWRKRELTLPVPVVDHQITQLKIDVPAQDLRPFAPVLIGDDRLGVPQRSLTSDATEKAVTFQLRTNDPDPGHAWVLVPLPRGASGSLTVEDGAGNRLREGDGYATSYYDGWTVIVTRTDGQDATRVIRF